MLPNPLYIQITGQLLFNDVNVGNVSRPDAQGLHRASHWEVHPWVGVGLFKAVKSSPQKHNARWEFDFSFAAVPVAAPVRSIEKAVVSVFLSAVSAGP